MIEFDNRTTLQLRTDIVEAIAGLLQKEIELIITDAEDKR
jgi:hypothetical protein